MKASKTLTSIMAVAFCFIFSINSLFQVRAESQYTFGLACSNCGLVCCTKEYYSTGAIGRDAHLILGKEVYLCSCFCMDEYLEKNDLTFCHYCNYEDGYMDGYYQYEPVIRKKSDAVLCGDGYYYCSQDCVNKYYAEFGNKCICCTTYCLTDDFRYRVPSTEDDCESLDNYVYCCSQECFNLLTKDMYKPFVCVICEELSQGGGTEWYDARICYKCSLIRDEIDRDGEAAVWDYVDSNYEFLKADEIDRYYDCLTTSYCERCQQITKTSVSEDFCDGPICSAITYRTWCRYDGGDVNLDGYVRANDARLALRFAADIIELSDEQILMSGCRLRGHDKPTASDARWILRVLAGIESPLYIGQAGMRTYDEFVGELLS